MANRIYLPLLVFIKFVIFNNERPATSNMFRGSLFQIMSRKGLVREHRTNEKLLDLLHLDFKSDTGES